MGDSKTIPLKPLDRGDASCRQTDSRIVCHFTHSPICQRFEMACWSKERQALRSRYIRLTQWNNSKSNTFAITVSDQTSSDSASLAGIDFLSARVTTRSSGNTCVGRGEAS